MQEKEYDLFMNMLRNKDASFDTFVAGGLNTNNTLLLERSLYESSQKVQEALKDLFEQFDKYAFDKLYNNAQMYYNLLSTADYDLAMQNQISYHRDDIFAPADLRRTGPDYRNVLVPNPYLLTSSIFELGKIGERTKSIDEIAQARNVLLNPLTAGENLENALWGEAPNDNFLGYFFDTLVLALYDKEGTHKDPITGEFVKHEAGDLKLDDTGNFYYEKLDGKDVYGRRVLNKMNVLTTDGSFWNRLDPFDSDDINQKSIGGSILKNFALVGTMFIPYVGPWITGLSIATLLAGLSATLGKMLVGSDNPQLSELEGWAKSVSRQGALTEYAQNNTWCWENFINLVGDVFGQLKELRFIFEKIPYALSGTNIYSNESKAAKLAELTKKQLKLFQTKVDNLRNLNNTKDALLSISELRTVAALKALAELDSFVKGFRKIGEVLSKGYMTAITVGDTYGEAKLAGASDLDATLLTLGYAAGEYALLNTGLGEWILPELRAEKYTARAMVKALANIKLDTQALYKLFGTTLKTMPKEGKKQYVKNLFNIGKNIAKGEYSTGSKTLKASLASGIGEGVEEVSEEFLADFSKGCYDVVKWLLGDDTRLNTFGYNFAEKEFNFGELIDRYSMSLVGGFIGGGLTNISTNYLVINNLGNMTPKEAIKQVVYMSRNGGIDLFLKEMNKSTIGDKNLSIFTLKNEDGTISFMPGTENDNLDIYIKKAINLTVNIILEILLANGSDISDESFLDKLTLGDLRFTALHNSSMAGEFLNEFNELNSDIVKLTSLIRSILNKALDTNKDNTISDIEKRNNTLSELDNAVIKKLEEQLKNKLLLLQDLLDGKRSYEFVADALFEMTTALSGTLTTVTFPLYAELIYKKKFSELTENEKSVAYEKYLKWKNTEGREHIKEISTAFRNISSLASKLIKDSANKYEKAHNLLLINSSVSKLFEVNKINEEEWLKEAQELVDTSTDKFNINLIKLLGSELDNNDLQEIYLQYNNIDKTLSEEDLKKEKEKAIKNYLNKLEEILLNNIKNYTQKFIDDGFINIETKKQLINLLLITQNILLRKSIEYDELEDDGLNLVTLINPYIEKIQDITSLKDLINKLNRTPLEENLNLFSISIGKEPLSITNLQERLNTILNDTSLDITKFNIDDDLYRDLKNAINTLLMYRAAILAARTDLARIGDLFGYNATLNEVSKKLKGLSYPELAEIDSTTADVFISDIDITLNKLQFLETLYNITRGLKLSRQDRLSVKKDILFYKRLKHLVLVPNDDELNKWEGFALLLSIINGLSIHDNLLINNSVILSNEQKEEFEKESILMLDAIYDFFLIESNKAKLNDPKLLALLINPGKFLLYTKATELLNEGLDNIDDNSMIWWLASRIAIRATDFYNEYKKIIDPQTNNPIAPIPTQELAIYNNYANIINGNIFSNFYKALRYSIFLDWKSKTIDLRKEVAKKLDIHESLLGDDMSDYCLNFLPVPKYLNIVFTEGIPGSGKSSAVYKLTTKLLKNTYPELLLNVFVVHGANFESANKLRDDINLEENNSKTFGRGLFMKEINPEWKEYLMDPIKHQYLVPNSDFTITNGNQIRSSLGIKETLAPPSLIIIDEISKFTTYDLDLIDRFALKYGITVLVAGDFDLSGVIGVHPLQINNKNFNWEINLLRTDFIRTPKLGISMRTDNSLKTSNLLMLLAYMQNPANDKITFLYYEDDNGLYGDKVILYSSVVTRNNQEVTSIDNSNKAFIILNILLEVDKLISTLLPNQKIGYIYSDKNSPLFSELSSDKYSPYIDFKSGGSAQGLEGLYYIIEADFNDNTTSYLKDVYTGMSRALLGSIIIAPVGEDKGFIKFDSNLVHQKIDEHLSKSSIAKFANDRKQILNNVVPTGNKIEYVSRTKKSTFTLGTLLNNGGLLPGSDSTPPPTPLSASQSTQNLPITKTFEQEQEEILRFILNASSEDELSIINEINEAINLAVSNSADKLYSEEEKLKDILWAENHGIGEIIRTILTETNATKLLSYLNITGKFLHAVNERIKQLNNKESNLEKLVIPQDTQQDKKLDNQKENVELEQKVESLIYEEDTSPIVLTDIISEKEYLTRIDTSNLTVNLPKSTVNVSAESIDIEMLLHSFNTFETGVLTDSNGYPIPVGSQEWMDARIDSINGLIKLDELLGHPKRTVKEYIYIISELRNILFNTLSKSDICTQLQKRLGLSNIYCTFALKSSPRPGEINKLNNIEFVDSKPSPFSKGISEKTLFNGSSDARSLEWHPKSIVAVIGSKDSGDIVELPLLALSSPFTLLLLDYNGNKVFSEISHKFNNMVRQKLPYYTIAIELIKEFDGNSKYQNLINLFKLYNFTDGGIFYIRDELWTPLNNLSLLGPQFVTRRGEYLGLPGLNYDANSSPELEWSTIEQLKTNPQIYVTENVLISKSGLADAGDRSIQIANPGHPFVLVSYDTNLNSDKKVADYYIRQETDSSVPKKVKLMYVIPPKATIREYLDNLHKILNKELGVLNIGQLFTSYKLLRILIKNDSFKNELERKSPGLFTKVEKAIQEVESITDLNEQKDKLFEPQDWSQEGFSSKPVKLAGLFDGVLLSFAYNRNTLLQLIGKEKVSNPNDTSILLMEAILSQEGIDGIYYNTKIPKNNPTVVGQFIAPLLGLNYTINGKPFKIHGKMDSYIFKGNMDSFVSYCLSRMVDTKNGHILSKDSFDYRNRNSNLIQNITPLLRIINNIIKYLLARTGKDFSEYYKDGDINKGNLLAARIINAGSNNRIAFIIGDKIKISNESKYLSGALVLVGTEYSDRLDTAILDNNGNYTFDIYKSEIINGEVLYTKYNAIYNSLLDELIITPEVKNKNSNITLSVTPENINEYINLGKEILKELFIFEPDIEEIFNKNTYEEFVLGLNELDYIGESRIDDYTDLLNTEGITDLLKLILNDLIELEKSHDNSKLDINNDLGVCPLSIKILFKI